MSIELKPCPLCGCKDIGGVQRKKLEIDCYGCGARSFVDNIEQWNTRTAPPVPSKCLHRNLEFVHGVGCGIDRCTDCGAMIASQEQSN